MPQFDAAVIGSGSFGAWIAYTLAQRGLRVALADAHGAGNSRASSGGETRIIRMSYGSSAIYSRMSRESLGLWKRLFADADQENLFVPSGALFTAPTGNHHFEQCVTTLTRLNIRHERLKPTALKKRYPQFHLPPDATGIFEPDSGVLLARRAVECVAAMGARLGVTQLQMKVSPTAFRQQIPAQFYVFACGPWLPALFPKQLGRRIFPTRQEVVFYGIPSGDARFRAPQMPAWVDFTGGIYTVPDIENRGLKVGIDSHGPAIDPERDARVISPAAVKRSRVLTARCFPALVDAPVIESRVCCYENSWNGDFLIDQLREDVWIAGGGSGHGFKHGPAVGRYLADRIENRIPPEPRFSLASKQTKQSRGVY